MPRRAYAALMSVRIDLADLPETVARFGPAYLLTTRDDRVKVLSVAPAMDGSRLTLTTSSHGSAENLAANRVATLVFPPIPPEEMTLLIDGTATAQDRLIVFTPEWAVLHQPATPEP